MDSDLTRRAVVAAVLIGATLWIVWLGGLADRGFDSDVDGNPLGPDHSVFYTAGRMVVDDLSESLYDIEFFNAQLADVRGLPVDTDSPLFVNPPALAYLFAPLSLMERVVEWIVLGAVGIALLGGAMRLVGVEKVWLGAGLIVLTLPGWLNLRLGQLAFEWVVLFALIYWLVRRERLVAAGLVAGLLAVKPQYAAVIALWWLLDLATYRKALAWLVVSGGTITVLTFALTPGSLPAFIDAANGAVAGARFPIGFSLNDTVLGLGPSLPDLPIAIGVAAIGIAAAVVVVRRYPHDLAAQFAVIVFAAVWIPPHLIAYDWALVGLGIAALWADRPAQRGTWLFIGATLALWSVVAWLFAQVAHDLWGVRLELAAVGLALIALWSYRCLAADPDSKVTGSRTIPLNV